MAIAHVQTTEITNTGGLANSATITVTANSLLVVEFAYLNSNGTVAVTDDRSGAGNVWTQDQTLSSGNVPNARVSVFSCPNAASGSTTITVTPAGSGTWRAKVREFSGADTSGTYVEQTSSNSDDTTSAPTATPSPGLTIGTGSLAITTWVFDRTPTPSGPTGWTTSAFASGDCWSAYNIFSGGASGERGAISSDATHYDAVLAVYKAAAGGGGGSSAGAAAHYYRQMQ